MKLRLIVIIVGLLCPAIFSTLGHAAALTAEQRIMYTPDSDDPTAEFPMIVIRDMPLNTSDLLIDALFDLGSEAYIVNGVDIDATTLQQLSENLAVDPSRIYLISGIEVSTDAAAPYNAVVMFGAKDYIPRENNTMYATPTRPAKADVPVYIARDLKPDDIANISDSTFVLITPGIKASEPITQTILQWLMSR